MAKIHYLMAKISLFDSNFIEARNLAATAQVIFNYYNMIKYSLIFLKYIANCNR